MLASPRNRRPGGAIRQGGTLGLYRFFATSDRPFARWARGVRRSVFRLSLPAPKVLVLPLLWVYLAARSTYHYLARLLVCEPLFKAQCTRYGRHVHTSAHLHWITGRGDIVLGDHVTFDGKSSIKFAARYADRPTLEVGSGTGFSTGCRLIVARRITVGRKCRIGWNVTIRDSNGHASDPVSREAGLPPPDDEVKPVRIGDNVWIGSGVVIGPGIEIGDGSIVSAQAVVLTNVPPYTIVAGNPARRIGTLQPPPTPTAEARAPGQGKTEGDA